MNENMPVDDLTDQIDAELTQDQLDLLSEEEQSEQKLNRLPASVDYDGKAQAVVMALDLKKLLALAVRKTVRDEVTGKTVKKAPAVMLTFQADKVPFIQNGIMYELDLSLGQRGAGAYLPIKVKRIGKVVEREAQPVQA